MHVVVMHVVVNIITARGIACGDLLVLAFAAKVLLVRNILLQCAALQLKLLVTTAQTSDACCRQLDKFKPSEMCNLVWGLGQLGPQCDPSLLRDILQASDSWAEVPSTDPLCSASCHLPTGPDCVVRHIAVDSKHDYGSVGCVHVLLVHTDCKCIPGW